MVGRKGKAHAQDLETIRGNKKLQPHMELFTTLKGAHANAKLIILDSANE